MSRYRLSKDAEQDFDAMLVFTSRTFGTSQVRDYANGLVEALSNIADFPNAGRQLDHIRPGLRMTVYRRHTIYYRKAGENIFVQRILGPGQDPMRAFRR